MAELIGKPRSALLEVDASGAFARTASSYRDTVSLDGPFPPTAGRYHLYVSLACPWAHRCLAVLYLKGLEGVVSFTVVHPTWQRSKPDDPNDSHCGWAFHDSSSREPLSSSTGHGRFLVEGCTADVLNGCRFVRDLYEMVKDTNGKYTVPVLWDKQTQSIVNNESSEIIRILNTAFDQFASNPSCDLYPVELRSSIDEWNNKVYEAINDGVYRCGFAKTQAAYDAAVVALLSGLDEVENRLSVSRYLAGNRLTESDIRLFVTLVRFDEVYVVYFKTNARCVATYPNIRDYMRELFQMPAFRKSTDMDHIKTHYYSSHPHLNPFAIIPTGPGVIEDLKVPHGRDKEYC